MDEWLVFDKEFFWDFSANIAMKPNESFSTLPFFSR